MSDMANGASRKMGRPETPLRDRFEAGFTRRDDAECWIWTALKDKDGYGITSYKTRGIRAHRVSWILNHGEIPPGMCVCHRCDNPSCVNPSHLFLGSVLENNRDRHRKGRSVGGNARFNPADVICMRKQHANGVSYSDIGRAFKTSATTVRNAVLGITWAHVKEEAANG